MKGFLGNEKSENVLVFLMFCFKVSFKNGEKKKREDFFQETLMFSELLSGLLFGKYR